MNDDNAFPGIRGAHGHGNSAYFPGPHGDSIGIEFNHGMTLRQYYFGQVAPAWVLAMSMRFHHEGYDDESAMMEAVRKAWQTANEMVAMQENGR